MDCLNSFCISLGQKISSQKSNMAISAGVDESLALRISALSKIPITTKMGKYNWNSLYYGKDEDGKFPPYSGKYSWKVRGLEDQIAHFDKAHHPSKVSSHDHSLLSYAVSLSSKDAL